MIAVIFSAYYLLKNRDDVVDVKQALPDSSELKGIYGVSSTPGIGDPSQEYVGLQQKQNIKIVKEAEKSGTSAVATIVRPTVTENIGDFESKLSQSQSTYLGGQQDNMCTPEALQRAREAGVNASELKCRGCSASELKAAGYTAGELGKAGFSEMSVDDITM